MTKEVEIKGAAAFDIEGYRRRIRSLRKLKGMNQVEFTTFTGIPYKKWNHYERGYPISREALWIIRSKIPGVSTDWIWFGVDTVNKPLLKLLADIEREDIRQGIAKRRA